MAYQKTGKRTGLPAEDIIGKVFGSWTVLRRDESQIGNRGGSKWICRCKCGTEKSLFKSSLRVRKSNSCGCTNKYDVVGKRFGKLVVLKRLSNYKKTGYCLCKCDCGKEVARSASGLVHGYAKSCGCSRGKYHQGQVVGNYRLIKRHHKWGFSGTWIMECVFCGKQVVKAPRMVSTKCACRGLSVQERLYRNFLLRAKQQKHAVDLTLDEFSKIIQEPCIYCGIPPTNVFRGKKAYAYAYGGIDRVDSSKGYVKNNVVPACKVCNKMKMDHDLLTFLEHCEVIAKNSEYLKNKLTLKGA